jgi:hypothetical protein
MHATHTPFALGAYAPRVTREPRTPRLAARIAVIGAAFAVMGYLMAVSFALFA